MVRIVASAAAFAALAALAAPGGVQTARSEIGVTFRQMNVPVEARFDSFTGAIDFDPRNPAAAHARIEVATTSFDIGAEEYNEEVRKREWLDTTAWPRASFVSSSVTPAGPGRFTATGTFFLKGRTAAVTVPFVMESRPTETVYQGEFPISRKAFAIGDGEWDSVLEDQVVVRFRIVAAHK